MEKTTNQIYAELKQVANDSGFVNEVVLAKSEDDVLERMNKLDGRVLFVVVQNASIYTGNDNVRFTLSVIDKTQFDDDAYLMSINDALGLLKYIYSQMNYVNDNEAEFSSVDIGSNIVNEEVITSAICDITFTTVYLPNINPE